jgi:hypothetical protein
MKDLLRYTIKWVAENLSIPFWIVGHVHLSLNVYNDIHELIASVGMNVIIIYLFVGEFLSFLFWFEYAQTHGFFNTLFIGFFVSQFKGLFWPFFI